MASIKAEDLLPIMEELRKLNLLKTGFYHASILLKAMRSGKKIDKKVLSDYPFLEKMI